MADAIWPATFLWAQDAFQMTFSNPQDFAQWANTEKTVWRNLAAGGQGWEGPINANSSLLDSAMQQPNAANLEAVAKNYRPSQGLLGKFMARIPRPMARAAAFTEIVRPGSLGNQNSPEFIEGRTLATFYSAIGGNLLGIERASTVAEGISSVLADVNKLRESDGAVTEKYAALVAQCDADWKSKIEGFEAKVALSSPRAFWKERAKEHAEAADKSRATWDRWMAGFVTLVTVAMSANIVLPPKNLTEAGVRVAIFATLGAISAWWVRQKLLDLRTHEHFAEDAAERATMVETYAAMRGAGLQAADLTPILTALYRPASGNLLDDSGPNLPLEIILKTATEAVARR